MARKSINQYDVIVIGAGISGLTAAVTITERDKHLSLLVVEQSSDVGGSEQTPELISNTNYFLRQLLAKLEIPVIHRKPEGSCFAELEHGKISISNAEIPTFGSWIEHWSFHHFIARIETMTQSVSFQSPMGLIDAEDLDEISMDEYICKYLTSVPLQNYMRIIVETSCGIRATEISALFYIAYCRSTLGITNQYRTNSNGSTGLILQDGGKGICNAIREKGLFVVHFEEEVVGIQRTASYALVLTTRELYKCLHVVMAIPSADILKIDYIPELPTNKLLALNDMKGCTQKSMVMNYDPSRWIDLGLSGDFYCTVQGNVIKRCVSVSNFRVDMLHVIVSQHDIWASVQQLNRYFKGSPMLWATDDHLCMERTTFFPKIGSLKNFHEIRRPINRMFFAGSECAMLWYGQIEGSVHSGVRAGIELLYDYKPQALSPKDITCLTKNMPIESSYKDTLLNKFINNKKFYCTCWIATFIIVSLIYKKFIK